MVKIAVNGAGGRMGERILALAAEEHGFEIAGAFDAKENRASRIETLAASSLKGKGVLIDFSSPEGTRAALTAALASGWGLVVGTTGLDEKMRADLKKASGQIPVVSSSNMSVGVNVVLALVAEAARKLSEDFTLQMTEAHHCHKKDAPSGTALMLLQAVADARKWNAERTAKEKGRIRSIREGEIVGDHTVLFSGPAETIEITHRAQSRDTFARGALLAARFVSSAKPGLYSMADVLKP